MVQVCVIGAGAAGLCAMHHIDRLEGFDGVVFEQTNDVGGVWVYEDPLQEDKERKVKHSVMYRDCRTNGPKETMQFLDFPFPEGNISFLTHWEMRQYLDDYADAFDLRKYIRFNTQVIEVTPMSDKHRTEGTTSWPQWIVRVRDLKAEKEHSYIFDAVLICNGHYSVPRKPEVRGMETFLGRVSYSAEYRYPERFKDKRVVIIGGGSSATDFALEICKVTSEVVVSMKKPPWKSPMPANIIQKPMIEEVYESGVKFQDGDSYKCEEIMLCAGYLYDFPFLSEACDVVIDDGRRVDPLYRHVVHMKYPTMAFIGLPNHIIPFRMFDVQVRWYLSLLSKKITFPSLEEMQLDRAKEEEERKISGFAPYHGHRLEFLQFKYYEKLATEAGFQNELKPVTEKVSTFVRKNAGTRATEYKQDAIKVLDRENFTYELNAFNYNEVRK